MHAVHGTLVVLAGILELFLLLLDALLDLRADLGDFDLGAEDLALLSLEGSLGLVEGMLELLLLDLQTADDLLHLVDGASSGNFTLFNGYNIKHTPLQAGQRGP